MLFEYLDCIYVVCFESAKHDSFGANTHIETSFISLMNNHEHNIVQSVVSLIRVKSQNSKLFHVTQ